VSEHLSAPVIEQYQRRQLPPEALLTVDDHLAACVACRELAGAGGDGERAFASLRNDLQAAALEESDHLSEAQLMAFVADDLNEIELESVQSHLEICNLCEADARDLLAFREELAGLPLVVPSSPTKSPASERPGFLRAWFVNWTPLQFAAAAVIVFCMVTATFLFRRLTRSPKPDVAAVRATPEVSPGAVAAVPSPAPSEAVPEDTASETVVALDDGGKRVTVDRQGNLRGLEELPPSSQRAVKTALLTKHAELPAALADLAGKSGTLLGGTEGVAFPLLSPVGTIIRSDRPTMRWRKLIEATNYTVRIFDAAFNLVAESPPLQTTSWAVPHQLSRGRVYSWHVAALKNSKEVVSPRPPAPDARFKVLEKDKATELERLEAAHPGSHLARGVLYAEAGLRAEAEKEFGALLKENPKSPVSQRLLKSVQQTRPQK
jgi:hypothetical protein